MGNAGAGVFVAGAGVFESGVASRFWTGLPDSGPGFQIPGPGFRILDGSPGFPDRASRFRTGLPDFRTGLPDSGRGFQILDRASRFPDRASGFWTGLPDFRTGLPDSGRVFRISGPGFQILDRGVPWAVRRPRRERGGTGGATGPAVGPISAAGSRVPGGRWKGQGGGRLPSERRSGPGNPLGGDALRAGAGGPPRLRKSAVKGAVPHPSAGFPLERDSLNWGGSPEFDEGGGAGRGGFSRGNTEGGCGIAGAARRAHIPRARFSGRGGLGVPLVRGVPAWPDRVSGEPVRTRVGCWSGSFLSGGRVLPGRFHAVRFLRAAFRGSAPVASPGSGGGTGGAAAGKGGRGPGVRSGRAVGCRDDRRGGATRHLRFPASGAWRLSAGASGGLRTGRGEGGRGGGGRRERDLVHHSDHGVRAIVLSQGDVVSSPVGVYRRQGGICFPRGTDWFVCDDLFLDPV